MSDNFKITKNNIKEILESMHDQIETALTECGMDAESYAKKECPVDPVHPSEFVLPFRLSRNQSNDHSQAAGQML